MLRFRAQVYGAIYIDPQVYGAIYIDPQVYGAIYVDPQVYGAIYIDPNPKVNASIGVITPVSDPFAKLGSSLSSHIKCPVCFKAFISMARNFNVIRHSGTPVIPIIRVLPQIERSRWYFCKYAQPPLVSVQTPEPPAI